MKWFSRYDQPYSPDLNSWAVLTAFQNLVHTLEDSAPDHPELAEAIRLLLTAETSCYWYWTGQHVWDQQVTNAANLGLAPAQAGDRCAGGGRPGPPRTDHLPALGDAGESRRQALGPGMPARCVAARASPTPSSPMCSGLKRVELVLRTSDGERRLAMHNHGPYPCRDRGRGDGGLFHRRIAGRCRRCALLHRGRGRARQCLQGRPGTDLSGMIRMKRLALLIPIAALIPAFFALGLHHHLTLDAFHASHETFDAWYAQQPWLVVGGYFAIFVLATLFLPIAALMTVVAGALFGFWKGVLIASFAAALAATLAFWLSRFILHDTHPAPLRRAAGGGQRRHGQGRGLLSLFHAAGAGHSLLHHQPGRWG